MKKYVLALFFAFSISLSTKPIACEYNPCDDHALWNIAYIIGYTLPIEIGYKLINNTWNDKRFPHEVVMLKHGGIKKIALGLAAIGWGTHGCYILSKCLLAKIGIINE